jgi:hypothetical protein
MIARLCLTLPLALALGACSETARAPLPLARPDRPALVLPLPDYPPARQALLAQEIEAAPPGAVWPGMIADLSTARRQICALTPDQAACRRICAASGNAYAFCRRA